MQYEELVRAATDVQERWLAAKLEYEELTYERAVLVAAAVRLLPEDLSRKDLAASIGIGAPAMSAACSHENPPGAGKTYGNRRRAFYRNQHGITDVADPVDWNEMTPEQP